MNNKKLIISTFEEVFIPLSRGARGVFFSTQKSDISLNQNSVSMCKHFVGLSLAKTIKVKYATI
jgi:hypothetical protein